jgi:hypothetical protein
MVCLGMLSNISHSWTIWCSSKWIIIHPKTSLTVNHVQSSWRSFSEWDRLTSVKGVVRCKLPAQYKCTSKKSTTRYLLRKVCATHTIIASQWDEQSVHCAEVTASKLYFGHHNCDLKHFLLSLLCRAIISANEIHLQIVSKSLVLIVLIYMLNRL